MSRARIGLSAIVSCLAATAAALTLATAPAAAEVSGSADGTAGLDPLLAGAYTLAEREAHAAGVQMWIVSGYRTPAEQDALWQQGLVQYGPDARRWVLPPDESTHVSGRAVDVGPQSGAQWLEVNGNRWGLCRTFLNEWWHFELVTVPGTPCPPMLPDASHR